jgi:import inner membrane translocase subunit TIM9
MSLQQREFERKMEEHIEEMRVTQNIAYFSRTVELCFSECVHSFRSKKLDDKETSCLNSCAEKFLRHTMRSSVRLQESYSEIMQQQGQAPQQ